MSLRFVLGFAAPWRGTLALCALLMLAESAAALAMPWLVGQFAGQVLANVSAASASLLLGLLLLLAAQSLLKFASSFLLSRTAEHVLADLRVRLYDHLQALPLSYHHQRRRGEILTLLVHDVAQLSSFVTGSLLGAVPLVLTVCGAIVLMLRIDARLALAVLAAVPLFYVAIRFMLRRVRPLARELQAAHADVVSLAEENLGMLPAIKTFTREPIESARYREKVGRVLSISARQRLIQTALGPATQFLAAASLVMVMWFMADTSVQRTPADMVSFLLYAALLTRPVSGLANLYGQTQYVRGALHRLGEVLTETPEPILARGSELAPVRGAIELRDVSFAYPGRPQILRNLSLHVHAGETIAITGPNGAGKSTLVHLLMRLIVPESGQILIDGMDIASVSLRSLRSQIGIVPQHVLLFHGTVHDNIAMGRPDADEKAIKDAARLAQAHDFISRLPEGYDSIIGDQGIRLSGGQRQRIALARAMLKNPPILILDEATAMFDPHGEQLFIRDCADALAGRTVILITHRPASLALADRVVQLNEMRLSSL